jgi:hypothetical protein
MKSLEQINFGQSSSLEKFCFIKTQILKYLDKNSNFTCFVWDRNLISEVLGKAKAESAGEKMQRKIRVFG